MLKLSHRNNTSFHYDSSNEQQAIEISEALLTFASKKFFLLKELTCSKASQSLITARFSKKVCFESWFQIIYRSRKVLQLEERCQRRRRWIALGDWQINCNKLKMVRILQEAARIKIESRFLTQWSFELCKKKAEKFSALRIPESHLKVVSVIPFLIKCGLTLMVSSKVAFIS